MTTYHSVAEGRAQAARLRPLGVVRQPASPRVACPDPTPQQLARLERERARGPHARGVIYPEGPMVIEVRLYEKARPVSIQAVQSNGRVTFTAYRDGRYWRVLRGQRGKVVARSGNDYKARLVVRGRLAPEEVGT